MQITCVAIDDEPLALELMKQYVSAYPELKLLEIFDDAIAGVAFLKAHSVDLLFIDVDMPDIPGVELVRSLPDKPMIIFTTAYKEFAHEGFELEALDYLLKPIGQERFAKAVHKVMEYYLLKNPVKNVTTDSLFVRSEYQLIKIDLNDIEYIESAEDYLKIHRTGTKPVMTLMTLKEMLEKLPANNFKRIHRSYIVPLSKIKAVAGKKVRLTTVELPFSDRYADFIHNWKKK
jgi:DNA-binding LytR/AlgR family response regulator